MTDWLDTLLSGSLHFDFPSLTLVEGDSTRFSGSGRLVWREDEGIRVHAITDGGEQLVRRFGFGLPVGQLVPFERYLSISGETQTRWLASTRPSHTGGSTASMESAHVIWDFNAEDVSLSRAALREGNHPRVLRALLGPSPKSWSRPTTTESHNEHFGLQQSSRYDSFVFQTELGTVGARARSDVWFEIQMNMPQSSHTAEPFDVLVALARAFGFLLGRRVGIRGFEDVAPGTERRYLDPWKGVTENALLPPLGSRAAYVENAERLLGMASNFFLTERGRSVGELLDLCWDTVDNNWTVHLTSVSICLEGLIRMASEQPELQHSEDRDEGFTPADLQAIERWLGSNPAALTTRSVERLRNFLRGLPSRAPSDVLWDWRRKGLLGISREDIEAWKRTRHPAAHAGLIGPIQDRDRLQARVTRFFRVQNLMNRVILRLMNYQGRYVDYSQQGWPEVNFPHSAAS